MLKHTLCAVMVTAYAASASASPETAEQWGLEAREIYAQTAEMIRALENRTFDGLSVEFEDQLIRFASTAAHLGGWTDETQIAPDLGCIYRGMAEEVELQLDAIEAAKSTAQMKVALTRLAAMADDAQSIAIASAHAGRTGKQAAPTGQCLSNAHIVDHALGLPEP